MARGFAFQGWEAGPLKAAAEDGRRPAGARRRGPDRVGKNIKCGTQCRHLTADAAKRSWLPRTGYITRIMRAARPDSGQGAPTVRESAPWPVRIIPPRYVCWPRQSPLPGGWGVGLGHEGRAQRRLDGQDQINKPRNTCVSMCCTRPLPRTVNEVDQGSGQH